MTKPMKPLYLLSIQLDASLAVPCIEESELRIAEPVQPPEFDWCVPPEPVTQVPNPSMDSFRAAMQDFLDRYRNVLTQETL